MESVVVLVDALTELFHRAIETALLVVSISPLIAVAGVLLFLLVIAAYLALSARWTAEQHVADLVHKIDAVSEKLSEAEKIGKFGSFTWDIEDPSESFWSEEMYALTGLFQRDKPPAIEAMVEVAHKADKEAVRTAWKSAMMRAGPFTFTYRIVLGSEQIRHVRVHGVTSVTSVGSEKRLLRITGVMHDITKEMEIDKAKSEFVSLASHQLKTPLTSIRWLSEALLGGKAGELVEKEKEYVSQILDANRRMVEMVNELLNVSKIELGTFATDLEEFDVCDLLARVVEEQKHMVDAKSIALRCICASDVPHLQGDKAMVRMILQNLVSNAIKYTLAKGSVECEITTGGARQDMLFIRVSDTGIGIPKAEQGRVFEKLHRASNAAELVPDGTGLGLYVVKSIAEKTGGNATFDSIEGKGTTFRVSVPLVWKENYEKKSVEM
ncbi:MAG: sensory transduction histidine kinase [Parcubacteria group bacterium Gr01-1014_8]|nr:MAG: sensory transduction histidine kinase [Parcubacteria group bacterium Gr01-1014_8]